MSELLNKAKEEFQSTGTLLLPNAISLKIAGEIIAFNEPLLGTYHFSDITLPESITTVLKHITGKDVTTGKYIEIGHRDYQLLQQLQSEHLAIIELTEEWEESYGGNIVLADGQGEHATVPFQNKSLFVTKEYPLWYISYCNHYANKKRRVIVIEF